MRRQLNLYGLQRRAGLADAVRSIRSNGVQTIAATVAVLMIIVPLIITVALVATGHTHDGGGFAVLALVLGAGAYTLFDVTREGKRSDTLARVAADNHISFARDTDAPGRDASIFRDGSHGIRWSLSFTEPRLVEVGDAISTTAPAHPRTQGSWWTADANTPIPFLRVGLVAPLPDGTSVDDLCDATTRTRATDTVGPWVLEATENELNLIGQQPLLDDGPRIAEAVDLAQALGERADQLTGVRARGWRPEPAVAATDARRGSAWRWVVATLLLLTLGPVAIALLFSSIDDHLRGRTIAAYGVLGVVLVVVFVVISTIVRRAMRYNRRRGSGRT